MPDKQQSKPHGRLVKPPSKSVNSDDETLRLESRPSPVLPLVLAATVSTLVLVIIVAACTVKIQQIVNIPGKLVTRRSTQVLSTPDTGVVREVLVQGGDQVKAGQALVVLDPRVQSSDVDELGLQLKAEASRLSAEKAKLGEKIAGLERQEQIDQQLLAPLQQLAAAGAASEMQVVEKQRVLQSTRRELAEARRSEQTLQFASERTQAQLRAQLVGARSKLELVTLRAPVKGTVIDLEAQTGQVVGSSTELLRLVPTDDLLAKVFAPSKDLAFVRTGQIADVSLDAYANSIYGVLEAKVSSVSEDALPADQQYNFPHFPIKLELNQQFLEKDGQRFSLQPGMAISAQIKLQKLTFVQLFFSRFNSRLDSVRRMR
ncbi:MAG: HlyD family secretion protein [Prochlorococcus sp.]